MQIDSNLLRSWKDDPTSTLVVAGLAVVFIGWRLIGDGTHGKEDILSAIEAEYVEDYRYRLYEKAKAADKINDHVMPSEYWQKMGADIDVTFENVSVAAPLLSWSAKEDVIINFDYTLTNNGETVHREKDRYLRVNRPGNLTYPSGPIAFYLKKFL